MAGVEDDLQFGIANQQLGSSIFDLVCSKRRARNKKVQSNKQRSNDFNNDI